MWNGALSMATGLSSSCAKAGAAHSTNRPADPAISCRMLTDAGALVLSLIVIRLVQRPVGGRLTYGMRRAEVLSGQANGAVLLVLGVLVTYEGISRLINPPQVAGGLVTIVAALGVVVNLAAAWVLAKANRESLNVEGSFQHIVTDLYAFIGTFVAGLVILGTGFDRADAIASLIVAGLMFQSGYKLQRKAMGDEDERHVQCPAQAVNLVLKAPSTGPVDRGERFIQKQHGRLACQRSRERDALALTSRQSTRSLRRLGTKANEVQHRLRSAAPFRSRTMADRCHHIAERRQVREERVLLKDQTDGPAMRRNERSRVGIGPRFRARSNGCLRRSVQARNRTENCRLATPRGSEDRKDLFRVTGEFDVQWNWPRLAQTHRQRRVTHDVD